MFTLATSCLTTSNLPGISLEGVMLKLKLQYFGYIMRRVDSLEKTLMLGGIGGRRRRGRQRMRSLDWHHWLDGRESEWTPGVGDGQGGLACCDSWGCKESDTTEWLNWTEMIGEMEWHKYLHYRASQWFYHATIHYDYLKTDITLLIVFPWPISIWPRNSVFMEMFFRQHLLGLE